MLLLKVDGVRNRYRDIPVAAVSNNRKIAVERGRSTTNAAGWHSDVMTTEPSFVTV